MAPKLNYFIELETRSGKKKWNGQRRGECFYIEQKEGPKADIYALWSHNPWLSRKSRESFKRRFYAPQYGWPWEQSPPIKDVLSTIDSEDAMFAAPYMPQPKTPEEQEIEKEATKPAKKVGSLSVVLEFHGFAEYPIVHVFATFRDAWEFVKRHPATIDFLTRAKIKPEEINYFEYENLADKLATRTTTTFRIHNQPMK